METTGKSRMDVIATDRRRIELAGVDLELAIHGSGKPLLLLAGEDQLENDLPSSPIWRGTIR